MPLSQNARGALLMTLAMGVFTANDALVKSVTPFMSVGQIMMIRGAMTTVMLLAIAWRMGALAHIRRMAHPLLFLRSIFEIAGTVTYVTALGSIQLANAGAIMQFIPLAVTLGASLFFREQVGWRRWLAILVGFIGVMIILRPTPSGFSFASLLVVLTVFLTAGRDLTTRRLGLALPALLVSLFAAVTNTVVGGLLILPMGGWHPVTPEQFGHLALASILLLMGYQSIILAMREGDVSFVAPFRYTSLIFALGLGYIAFDEQPDGLMVLGSCLIIASGLYAFYRERQRAQSIAAETSAGTASG